MGDRNNTYENRLSNHRFALDRNMLPRGRFNKGQPKYSTAPNPYQPRIMRGPSIQDQQKQADKKRYLAKLNGHAEKIQYEAFINY